MYNADKLTSIDLGRQGENLARTVEIDVSGMLAQWPDATITLLVKRKHDAEPYIVDTTVKDGVLFWPITAVETADAGDGKLEIRATCGEVIAKSATGSFRVTASLTGSGTEPPVTEQGWVERVLAAGPVWNRTPLWRLRRRAERKQQLKTPVKARLRYRPLWKQQRRKRQKPRRLRRARRAPKCPLWKARLLQRRPGSTLRLPKLLLQNGRLLQRVTPGQLRSPHRKFI